MKKGRNWYPIQTIILGTTHEIAADVIIVCVSDLMMSFYFYDAIGHVFS